MRNSVWPRAIHLGVLLILLGTIAQIPALAEESTEPPHEDGNVSHENTYHRNHFKGIIGWSHKDSDKDSTTIGMEYTRMLTRRIGLSAYLEMSEGQFKADTAGITLSGFVTKQLFLLAGPGVERSLFEEKTYLLRAGLGYEFEPKGLLVSPYAWVDFVDGHKIYFVGVGVGKGF